jgi:hypothetical protein
MPVMTSPRALRFRFVAAICAGSFLLFLVQPMIARMALPRLGGAPAVWNSAMLVYQALLLGGYAYAHMIGRFAPRTQAALHVALLLGAALMLPIGLSGAMPDAGANPFIWVPYLFIASIGPLFFVISAQAPLLQRWYADAGGGDPYPLYAASNLGSFGGLIAYPLLVEPLLPLKGQSWLWSAGYALVVALVALCALVLPKAAPSVRSTALLRTGWKQLLMWTVLAAVPSGLMLSTTTHLTTDIVAMPLLWVLPLGLYLLSFSIAFSENRALPNAIITVAPLILMIGGGVAFATASSIPWLYAAIGLILLFTICVALHAMLYDRRPALEQLTGFYLVMSAGGVLGGIFCALVAPVIFDWAYEHPVLIIAAGLLVAREPLFAPAARIPMRFAFILALVAVIASMISGRFLFFTDGQAIPEWISLGVMVLIVFIGLAVIGRRIPFAMTLVALMLTLGGWNTVKTSFNQEARTRSFFGVYTVGNSGGARFLQHGTTLHGEQSLEPGRERDPLTYYAPMSGVGLAMAAAPQLYGPAARIGVVGLGAGTLSCYARHGQDWRFYEIDPAIAAIARDPAKFTFLSRCLPAARVIIGDARLTIAADRDPPLDLLVIDAFSSDAVPMHLLTKEALETYARRLGAGGLLMIHISNRYMKLEPVLAEARRNGWTLMARQYEVDLVDMGKSYSSSLWIALARDPKTIDRLAATSGPQLWRPVVSQPGFPGWTDDYASILPLIKWSGK